MPEARSDFRPRPTLPAAPPRRAGGVPRPSMVNGGEAVEPPSDEPSYPVDPPLVDVRIPVKAPHATATAYSRAALMHHFPNAELGDDLHVLFREPSAGRKPGRAKQRRLSPDVMVAPAARPALRSC